MRVQTLICKNRTKVSIWRDVGKDIHNISFYISSRVDRTAVQKCVRHMPKNLAKLTSAKKKMFSRMALNNYIHILLLYEKFHYSTNPFDKSYNVKDITR